MRQLRSFRTKSKNREMCGAAALAARAALVSMAALMSVPAMSVPAMMLVPAVMSMTALTSTAARADSDRNGDDWPGKFFGSHRIWHVSASAAAGGNGSAQSPFNSLALVQQASGPGDTIIVDPSPTSVPPLDGGIALKAGQRLIGGGPPILQSAAPLADGGPPVVAPSALSSLPRITNTKNTTNSGDAVDLASHTRVENVVIAGAYRGAIYGLDAVDVSIRGNDLSGFNTSGTAGFVVQHFYLESYTPFVANDVAAGIPAGWAGILIDVGTVTTHVFIEDNYVHDGSCGDGIDLRGMGTGDITAEVNGNLVTRLPQCSSIRTMEGIGTQVTGTSRLVAHLDRNTEADNGSAGANADSLFVNPAEAGTLIETIEHNVYLNGIGGASTNGMEFILSNGSANAWLKISNSFFATNPGDMLEEFNRGEAGSVATLILDHVIVKNTTFTGGIPSYADPPGKATTPDNTGECLGIGSVGANDTTILEMIDSEFTGCDNNGIEVTNNHTPADGTANPHTVLLDIKHSKISGSRYYNLWIDNVTPLTDLKVRVEDSDLSMSTSGVAIGFDQQLATASTMTPKIDLGGGVLGSRGRNCIFGGALLDLEGTGYNVAAEHNWWGSPAGPQAGKVTASPPGFSIDSALPLAEQPPCGSSAARSGDDR